MKKDTAMADSIGTPNELLNKPAEGGEFDLSREALLSVLREIIEIEVERKTGAYLGEYTTERLCHRNGCRRCLPCALKWKRRSLPIWTSRSSIGARPPPLTHRSLGQGDGPKGLGSFLPDEKSLIRLIGGRPLQAERGVGRRTPVHEPALPRPHLLVINPRERTRGH